MCFRVISILLPLFTLLHAFGPKIRTIGKPAFTLQTNQTIACRFGCFMCSLHMIDIWLINMFNGLKVSYTIQKVLASHIYDCLSSVQRCSPYAIYNIISVLWCTPSQWPWKPTLFLSHGHASLNMIVFFFTETWKSWETVLGVTAVTCCPLVAQLIITGLVIHKAFGLRKLTYDNTYSNKVPPTFFE